MDERSDAELIRAASRDPAAFGALRAARPGRVRLAPRAPGMGGERPHRRDLRPGVAEPEALPRRARRVGTAVAPRHRAQRPPRVCSARPGRDPRAPTPPPPARAGPRGRLRRRRRAPVAARLARGGARRAARARARGGGAARGRRARLRRGRGAARDQARRRAAPRLARAAPARADRGEGRRVSELPASLVSFRSELERAVERERAALTRRRAIRLAAAGGAAAAIGILSVLPGSEPGVVERARAALAVDGDAIVHIKTVTRRVTVDGAVQSITSETWDEHRASAKAPGAH